MRRLGLTGSIAYYVPRAVSRITAGRCTILPIGFYAQPVRTDRLLRERTENGVVVGLLSLDSVPESAFGRPRGVVAERFEAGHACIGAMKNSVLQGFMWISMGSVEERRVRCVFEPGPVGYAAWDYDFFILPEYRLGRTFARLWDEARNYLRARGIKATVSWIELSNSGSIRAHERIGARRVGWAVFITTLNAQTTLCSVPPYIHWSRPGGASVRIRVNAKVASLEE